MTQFFIIEFYQRKKSLQKPKETYPPTINKLRCKEEYFQNNL